MNPRKRTQTIDGNIQQLRKSITRLMTEYLYLPGTTVPIYRLSNWSNSKSPVEGLELIQQACKQSDALSIQCVGDLAEITYYQLTGIWIQGD